MNAHRTPALTILALTAALLAAACEPAPSATPAPPVPTESPLASPVSIATVPPTPGASPSTDPGPPATPSPSVVPVDLPPPFDAIPWAHVDLPTRVVSIGVLGQPSTTSRTTTNPDAVRAIGTAVLVPEGDEVEVVDAASGSTVARFTPDALRQEHRGNSVRQYARQQLEVDIEHGYLYQLDSNARGMRIWRFRLDGTDRTVLATIAPDPEDEFWANVGLVLRDTGELIAVACPPEQSTATDRRCRVWRIEPGANAPIEPTILPASVPALCAMRGASERYLFAWVIRGCGADGGVATYLSWVAVDLDTGDFVTRTAPSSFLPFTFEQDEGFPYVVGNLFPHPAFGPAAYPATAALMNFAKNSIDQPMSAFFGDGQVGSSWAIRGAGPGWTVLQAFGPDYAACHVLDPSAACPLGPVVLYGALDTPDNTIELPRGTYGEILPPYETTYGATQSLPIQR